MSSTDAVALVVGIILAGSWLHSFLRDPRPEPRVDLGGPDRRDVSNVRWP